MAGQGTEQSEFKTEFDTFHKCIKLTHPFFTERSPYIMKPFAGKWGFIPGNSSKKSTVLNYRRVDLWTGSLTDRKLTRNKTFSLTQVSAMVTEYREVSKIKPNKHNNHGYIPTDYGFTVTRLRSLRVSKSFSGSTVKTVPTSRLVG